VRVFRYLGVGKCFDCDCGILLMCPFSTMSLFFLSFLFCECAADLLYDRVLDLLGIRRTETNQLGRLCGLLICSCRHQWLRIKTRFVFVVYITVLENKNKRKNWLIDAATTFPQVALDEVR
jgi:hypothetical protein